MKVVKRRNWEFWYPDPRTDKEFKLITSSRFKTIRRMPFGMFKGYHVLDVIGFNPSYMQWVVDHCNFILNEEEKSYLKESLDIFYKKRSRCYGGWENTNDWENMAHEYISPWGSDFM